jgi:hypothetical protein
MLRLGPLSRWCIARPRAAARAKGAARELWLTIGAEHWIALTFARWDTVDSAGAELERLRAEAAFTGDYLLRLETEMLARGCWLRGRIAEHARACERLAALSASAGDDQTLAWAFVYDGRRLLWSGELALAERAFDEARRLQIRRPDKQVQAILAGESSLARVRLGRGEEVARDADAMLDLVSDSAAWPLGTTDALAALAEALLALHVQASPAVSSAQIRRALGLAKAYARAFPTGRPPYALQQGAADAAAGRWFAAARTWRRGLREAERLGLPMERARLLDALSACPRLGSAERARLADEAGAIAAACGSPIPPRLWKAV